MTEVAVLEDKKDAREAVCARLQRVREISGLNKKDFSAKLDMSPQAWGEYENGKRGIPHKLHADTASVKVL